MKLLRILLFPFAIIYGIITSIRNVLYDNGILKSYGFPVPVIAVGNLSTGGTGKTPQIEYLIRLLSDKYNVATLSRGYKRKSKGYILADGNTTPALIGDEPYQFFGKFPSIKVAVDANRKNGIEQLLKLSPKPDVILLDDAFQHRKVKAGFYILLTAYGDIYAEDFMLPTGNLREGRGGARRADIIIVTKCPPHISKEERQEIIKKLDPQDKQAVYFTYIEYDNHVYSGQGLLSVDETLKMDTVLVAGIAKPQPFFDYLNGNDKNSIAFPDHHNFTEEEISRLEKLATNSIIITTEKDFVRLKGKLPASKLYYLPIKSTFIEGADNFNKSVVNFLS